MLAAMASTTLAAGSARSDFTTIAVIGAAHGASHFFHLLLPPLFPAFMRDFGASFSELGLLVSVFFLVSGLGQAVAGFVVDRVGARPVLFGAMGCFVAAALAAAAAQGLGGLLAAALLAGLGNAPFHPADFTILNKRVSSPRLGHAFSVHGITGNLGWAAAPVFLIGVSEATGSWRTACVGAALIGLAVIVLLALQRDAIDDRLGEWAHQKAGAAVAAEPALAFLKLPPVWLCFAFFFCTAAALAAVQSFAAPALERLYALPLASATLAVTGFMLSGAAGLVAGGFLVARQERLERTIAAALALSAALLLLVGSGWLAPGAAAAAAALAGVGTGLAGPSRDMLIRRAAPPGATGRVYGMVYSGLDAGFALAAPAFGWLLDHGRPGGVFGGAAAALVLGIASAGLVALAVRRRVPAPVPA